MKLIATSAIIILAMLTTSAFAQTSNNTMRTQARIIRTADLDLSKRDDVRVLNNRVNVAIDNICGSASAIDLEGALSVTKCRDGLSAQTRGDLSRAISIAQRNANKPVVQPADAAGLPSGIMPPSGTQR